MQTGQTGHLPVLLEEVLEYLQPKPGGMYIDGTVGGGGHTEAILAQSAPDGKVLGIDTDALALERVSKRLASMVDNGRLALVRGNFAELARIVQNEADFVSSIEGILLDLGFSSYQMDEPQRGFSFSADGPLDMRLDQSQELTAADLVNNASEEELARIFWKYGEENRSRQIAWRIVQARARRPITRTSQLAQLAAAGVPYKPGMIHPATRVFQALRIAVNGELEQLEAALPQMLDVLSAVTIQKTGGSGQGRQRIERSEMRSASSAERPYNGDGDGRRMVIISFHSLEDRLVKGFMRREASDCICPPGLPVCVCGHKARLRILTPKPVTPTNSEVIANPRARSAKLRAAEIIVAP
jgi:16S rRNA (cytosine1402-N4)-methyltransferase